MKTLSIFTFFVFCFNYFENHGIPRTIIYDSKYSYQNESKFKANFNYLKHNIANYVKNRAGYQIFDFIFPFGRCNGKISRHPANSTIDGGKFVCDELEETPNHNCLIYSFGSNNDFLWEDLMFKRYKCEIHVFDCTQKSSWNISKQVNFHKLCIDKVNHKMFNNISTILTKLNHKKVHFLKLDIEGAEYESIKDLSNIPSINLPDQIAVEIHHEIFFTDPIHKKISKMTKIVEFFEFILQLGYKVISREDNYLYSGGTELLFIRNVRQN